MQVFPILQLAIYGSPSGVPKPESGCLFQRGQVYPMPLPIPDCKVSLTLKLRSSSSYHSPSLPSLQESLERFVRDAQMNGMRRIPTAPMVPPRPLSVPSPPPKEEGKEDRPYRCGFIYMNVVPPCKAVEFHSHVHAARALGTLRGPARERSRRKSGVGNGERAPTFDLLSNGRRDDGS